MAELASDGLAGLAPYAVNFTVNGTDPDHDPLRYTLRFSDGTPDAIGSLGAAAARIAHTFASAGAYDVTLNVTDGGLNGSKVLRVTVDGSPTFSPFTLSGTPKVPCKQCTQVNPNSGVGYRAGINELDSAFGAIPADAAGRTFLVVSAASGGDPEISFRESCNGGGSVQNFSNHAGPEGGIVPEGALCALMWENGTMANAALTLTIT
jgi:hypothetical protein